MKNWAKWLIDHNLRWVLYVVACLIQFPIYLAENIVQGIIKAFHDTLHDINSIKNEPKRKKQ
jgi:hypothetical protein